MLVNRNTRFRRPHSSCSVFAALRQLELRAPQSRISIDAQYNLDAESRKLRALESRGGSGLSAFERSDDATKGPQGALMRVVSMD